MMDRVIGGSGCSFSALIALKLFGYKKRNFFKKDLDFEEALNDMLEEELEDDTLEKPFKWYSYSPTKFYKIYFKDQRHTKMEQKLQYQARWT